jgi:hypothetical protein
MGLCKDVHLAIWEGPYTEVDLILSVTTDLQCDGRYHVESTDEGRWQGTGDTLKGAILDLLAHRLGLKEGSR